MAENASSVATAELSSTSSPSSDEQPVRRRGRWLRFGLVILVLLAGAAWLAPQIIGMTALRQRVPAFLFPTYPGTVELGEASLGWLSPVVIHDLKGTDEKGQPLFEVREFSTSETLWTLATASKDYGTFKLVDPVLHLKLRNDGSNAEDVLTKFLSGPESAPVDVRVEVENAKLDCEHEPSKRSSLIEPVSLLVVSKQGGVDQFNLVSGVVPQEAKEANDSEWLAVSLALPTDDAKASDKSDVRQLQVRAASWKLEQLVPLLRRLQARAELAGTLNIRGTGELSLATTTDHWKWDGHARIRDVLIAGLDGMKNDRLALKEVELSGLAAAKQGQLAAKELRFASDFGEIGANGQISLAGWNGGALAELTQRMLREESINVTGTIELKPLAAAMPQTLRVREGTEITDGTLHISLQGPAVDAQKRWHASVKLAGLEAINDGQKISWTAPVEASISAHRDGDQFLVDRISCESEFLKVSGNGTWEKAQFKAVGDLDKLQQNLERLIELGPQQFAGLARAEGTIRSDDDGKITLASKVLLDDFSLVMSKQTSWHEKHLELTLTASAQTDENRSPTRLNSGDVRLISADDSLELKLREPVDLRAQEPRYSATVKLNGELVTWQNRLQPFLDLQTWRLAGQIDTTISMVSSPRRIDVSDVVLGIEQLQARGPGWLINEPHLKLTTSGTWDVVSQTWSAAQTKLVSESVAAEIDDMVCVLGESGLSKLSGDARYRANIEQVLRWSNSGDSAPTWFLAGQLSGTSRVTDQAGILTGNIDAQVEHFTLFTQSASPGQPDRWEPAWAEPRLQLKGQGRFDTKADSLMLEPSSLDVDGLSVTAKGTLLDATTRQQVDLSGELNYDWDKLRKRFGESLSRDVQITGNDRRPFSLRGSLASLTSATKKDSATPATSDVSGEAGIGWTTANVFGLNVGAAEIGLKLDKGRGAMTPLDFAVNEGRLHLAPQLRLDSEPAVVILPKDKVLDQVRLTPELCGQWLKFVAPLLADSTQVDGKFSLDITEGTIPVTSPTSGDVTGTMSVHQVQVRPGSLAIEIFGAVDQIRSIILRRPAKALSSDKILVQMPEQSIPFRLTEGRVTHQAATFVIQQLTVQTSGSVGVDETLNLVAEIPIPDEWLGEGKVFANLKGKVVQIPIGGTLNHPKMDGRVFQSLARQMGTSAVESLLQDKGGDQLKKGLDKLFTPKKKK